MTKNSIVSRLQSLAQAREVSTDKLLSRWVRDGFLARIACSSFAERIVLKGAALYNLWDGDMPRSTRDLNLHLKERDYPYAHIMLRQVSKISLDPLDGIQFAQDAIHFAELPGRRLPCLRMSLDAAMGKTLVPLKVNVVFGDPITPGPETRWYPRLLHDFDSFPIRTYPRETVVAEKLATAVEFGRDNSRLRDYYDLWCISGRYHFSSHILGQAIEKTFSVRRAEACLQTDLEHWKSAFSPEFVTAANSLSWNQWLADQAPTVCPPAFGEVVARVREFSIPPLIAAAQRRRLKARWVPGARWVKTGMAHLPPDRGAITPMPVH